MIEQNSIKIVVVGLGYVGMSLIALLSGQHDVVAVDIDPDRVDMINHGQSTVADLHLENFLLESDINLRATLHAQDAYKAADFVIVATPTNYDPMLNHFDTRSVEQVISDVRSYNKEALIVIKSTVPVGFTQGMRDATNDDKIVFSPEFLREGQALYDNQYPARIIVGSDSPQAVTFAEILKSATVDKTAPVLMTGSTEAEAIKLFANTFLAMRVSFFNELDSFALSKGLQVGQIIDGICLDHRIGSGYNNPSFGYGGYCLPKDTKQLLANYEDIPQQLIRGVVGANQSRKNFIVTQIMKRSPGVVGIYRMAMKKGSDNIRSSAISDILEGLVAHDVKVIVYEPLLTETTYLGADVVHSLDAFFAQSDLIVSNRNEDALAPYQDKVFTRDIYGAD